MLKAKVNRKCQLVTVDADGVDTKQQRISRYYVSTLGGSLVAIHPPLKGKTEMRRKRMESGYVVSVCNDAADFDWSNVDYNYYIDQANKLVNPLMKEGLA